MQAHGPLPLTVHIKAVINPELGQRPNLRGRRAAPHLPVVGDQTRGRCLCQGSTFRTALESQLASLTGQVEERGFQMRQLETQLKAMQDRLARLEAAPSSTASAPDDDSPVSATIFDAEAIDVLCQSLGFTTGEQVLKANVPEGAGQIWLDNLDCVGTESSITECAHLGYGVNSCSHSEDVGIRCY